MSSIVLAYCAACAASLALVPIVKRICDRIGLSDHPDQHRKLHRQPIALGGGIVAFTCTLVVSVPLLLTRSEIAPGLSQSGGDLVGLALASTIIVLVGVIDDAIGLSGRQKLVGQLAACSTLVAWGLVVERFQVLGWTFELGPLSVPLTLLWLLAAINAINLLDGINGLAATVGIIDSLAIAVLSALGGHRSHALVAAAFAGALFGFLRYNFPRARIFLGDAGSMLIGLVIGGLAMQTSLKGPGTVLLATPLCLMTVPLFDSAAAMIRRKLTGRSIFSGDRAHLQHRLTERFGSTRAVGIVALSCAVCAFAALASIIWSSEMVAVVSATAVIAMFVVSKMFGHAELLLLTSRVHSIVRSSLPLNGSSNDGGRQSAVHFQGSRGWEQIWADLKEAALDLHINNIELSVNAPMIQEGFHGSWIRPGSDFETGWRLELPLCALQHRIGHIRFGGERRPNESTEGLEKILSLVDSLELQVEAIFPQPILTVSKDHSELRKSGPLARRSEVPAI